MSTIISEEKLAALREKGRVLVTLKQRLVYDVTDFLDDHPGGGDLITDLQDQDVTLVMDDPELHQHSESAYVVMQEYLIGQLPAAAKGTVDPQLREDADVAAGDLQLSDAHEKMLYDALHEVTDADRDYEQNQFLDLNRPLLWQVMTARWSRAFYIEQVHKPRHYKHGSAPIFGNFLEPLSLTPWWVIPLIWIPGNLYVQYTAMKGLSVAAFVPLYSFGLLLWTLVEYLMHRCLFHLDDHLPDNQVAITLHFLMHGVHHYLPMDRMRLVMPPALFFVLATPLYYLCHFVFRQWYVSQAIFAGAHMGYVLYDCTHYFLHHKQLPKLMKDTKVWHLDHHYKDFQRGFGVTTRLWDVVFGTTFVDTSAL